MGMRLLVGLSIVSMLLLLTGGARAELITFEFGGVITSVTDANGVLGGAVHVGDAFGGTYVFDSNASDSYPADPSVGVYFSAGGSVAVNLGSSLGIASSGSRTVVGNYTFADTYGLSIVGPFDAPDFGILEMEVFLRDSIATVFTSDALPLSPPSLAARGRTHAAA
jgi:hypothetical protein